MKPWPRVSTGLPGQKPARAPLIISASRATDIPAFYGKWLISQFEQGYTEWKNPYSGIVNPVNLSKCRLIIFWTKNAAPFIDLLSWFDSQNINYYFLYTINSYDSESYEPGLPPLDERISTFKKLSQKIGRERVLWRFDPILVSNKLPIKEVTERLSELARQLTPFTCRLIFSFIKIHRYQAVQRNCSKCDSSIRELTLDEKLEASAALMQIMQSANREDFFVQSCGSKEDLSSYGIEQGSCIDYDLITGLFNSDEKLMDFLEYEPSLFDDTTTPPRSLKATGQQPFCRCLQSADIGFYNSCPHGCVYCYANHSPTKIKMKF
ncbi:MAG: DUF1848 domain-containing protein [Spirochaetes bacterium]|jgi:hypothetical protein|nr:DUF1848 domain-containing protein [Spirochaetota bacterium]